MELKHDGGSSRHHYIPIYYSKSWTAADGHFNVYDKVKDDFFRRRLSPKQLFFTDEGNTAQYQGQRNTFAERAFQLQDSLCAPMVEQLRRAPNDGKLNTPQPTGTIHMLAVNQYFRVPANDFLYKLLFEKSEFIVTNQQGNRLSDLEDRLRGDETQKKVHRALLPFQLLMETMKEVLEKSNPLQHTKLFEWSYPLLVLTDNPVVYLKTISKATDLLGPFLFPLSSTRIYAQDETLGMGTGPSVWLNYNALAIDQATRLVCAPNITLLKASVTYWKELRQKGYLPFRKEFIFSNSFMEKSA